MDTNTKSIISEAAQELKELLAIENIYLSDDEAIKQSISLLNLFGALTQAPERGINEIA